MRSMIALLAYHISFVYPSLPNRLYALPNRLYSLPDRLYSLPNRLYSLPNRLYLKQPKDAIIFSNLWGA